jgi:hypothetical protein
MVGRRTYLPPVWSRPSEHAPKRSVLFFGEFPLPFFFLSFKIVYRNRLVILCGDFVKIYVMEIPK